VNYGITFPVFAKTAVVGANANPLFRQLATRTVSPPAESMTSNSIV
jgi:glutathione peroxidase-family protein